MEKENKFGEQSFDTPQSVATHMDMEGRVDEDSPIDKFKNAKALMEAYKSLQSEFTKKCQKLSEYEKEQDNAKVPCYRRDDWQNQVREFFESNPEAKFFGEQIVSEIISDNDLAMAKSPLVSAYNRVVKKQLSDKENFLKDENNLVEYVLKNEQILTKILKKCGENAHFSPKLISSNKSSTHIVTPSVSAKSLDEAKQILKKMFNT